MTKKLEWEIIYQSWTKGEEGGVELLEQVRRFPAFEGWRVITERFGDNAYCFEYYDKGFDRGVTPNMNEEQKLQIEEEIAESVRHRERVEILAEQLYDEAKEKWDGPDGDKHRQDGMKEPIWTRFSVTGTFIDRRFWWEHKAKEQIEKENKE